MILLNFASCFFFILFVCLFCFVVCFGCLVFLLFFKLFLFVCLFVFMLLFLFFLNRVESSYEVFTFRCTSFNHTKLLNYFQLNALPKTLLTKS